ncbi:MAG: twin-arginine translocase TatA/TatE family subunit [Paludibacteraceae bacterium]|nr:twin-arginine translocase TatA/TatE family subunit [Paludibacteraceae bacterium]
MLLMIGTTELLLISGVALLLFGGKKLPELMKSMGQGVKNFKEGMNEPVQKADDKGGNAGPDDRQAAGSHDPVSGPQTDEQPRQ